MDFRTCSRCKSVVDIDGTPPAPDDRRFGSARQSSICCPHCNTTVHAVLHDEDSVNTYSIEADELSAADARDVAKGEKRIGKIAATVTQKKPTAAPPPTPTPPK